MPSVIRIATRESALALWQAHYVKSQLESVHPGLVVEIRGMTTAGDRNKSTPLSRIGGKGLFVKELETALLDGSADIAVHSMKDVPAELPAGLEISAICEREDPRDAFVSVKFKSLEAMPSSARLGTSSLRRRLQIKKRFPDLVYPDLRGNVDTRLRKLDDGEYEGIILAAAGLKRLGLADRITVLIERDVCLPSAGQGAVGIESRADANWVSEIVAAINHAPTALRVRCERRVSSGLGANCTLPIGAFAEIDGDLLRLSAFVSDVDGEVHINVVREGDVNNATAVAELVIADLIERGAARLIQSD